MSFENKDIVLPSHDTFITPKKFNIDTVLSDRGFIFRLCCLQNVLYSSFPLIPDYANLFLKPISLLNREYIEDTLSVALSVLKILHCLIRSWKIPFSTLIFYPVTCYSFIVEASISFPVTLIVFHFYIFNSVIYLSTTPAGGMSNLFWLLA